MGSPRLDEGEKLGIVGVGARSGGAEVSEREEAVEEVDKEWIRSLGSQIYIGPYYFLNYIFGPK